MTHHTLPRSLADRDTYILQRARGQKVLHVGFADAPYTEARIKDGSWLHNKILDIAASCTGVDLNDSAVELLRSQYRVPDIVPGDAEHLDEVFPGGTFDLIVAGEIIEHLNNPGLFLASARRVLSPKGQLLITTTNAFCLRRLLRIPTGKESVHPDHTYYFSHVTLSTLVRRHGYHLLEAHAYSLPGSAPFAQRMLDKFSTLISPNWGEGLIHTYAPALR